MIIMAEQTNQKKGTADLEKELSEFNENYAKTSKKEGLMFIERPKSKINTPSEKKLLNLFRIKSRRR